jgi:hydroxypyruvate isomerase
LTANRGSTYLATFRAVAKKYPHKAASEILVDLVKTTPDAEGKWFAAAKDAGLFAEALALAERTPCDPRTLTRAARDHVNDAPDFALGAGLLALHWLAQGYGYEITGADVLAAYSSTMKAAERTGRVAEVKVKVEEILATDPGGFVARVLGAVDDGV